MSFIVTKNTFSPTLRAMARKCSNLKPVLEAMGTALVAVTKRAFSDTSLRPTEWPAVKTGKSPLRRTGTMWQSIRITELTGNQVKVGTDRPYAAWQQFGTKGPYTIKPKNKKALFFPGAAHPMRSVQHPGLPPRPFFPFTPAGEMTEIAKKRIESAARAKLISLLNLK